ncbi:porin OmpA [Pantoea sp. Mhis]|uniref:porin OmpA n=1 Tax=Pantoea sp. Mhis TaxID=2576759 RepID=UPI00135A148C|nr:porin OmpA [Pantoea sp. Mhis]MXP56143.1 porin OmpA [Pantoea sp. Mhis]
MNKTAIAIAISLIGYTSVAQSMPKDHIWYSGAKLSWSRYHDTLYYGNNYENNDGPTLKSQLGAGAFLGYKTKHRYLDFELGYDWLGRMAYKGDDVNGAFKAQGVQLTTKLNYPINSKLGVYTRLGGMVWRADSTQSNLDYNRITNHDTGISPLAAVGIEYALNKHWSTRLDYQWVSDIGDINTVGTQPDNGSLTIGISYHFSNDEEKNPIITPASIPVVKNSTAIASVKPKHFNSRSDILFKFNNTTLSMKGKQTLEKVYNQFKTMDSKNVHIMIVGFSDRIGSKIYNQKLSKKRSQSVVNYLISKGVPYKNISSSSQGKINPVTGHICDNIKSRNVLIKCLAPDRRVEINMQGVKNVVT